MRLKIDNYLQTRGILFFIIFIFLNILALLPFENVYIDIFSHFKFQYILFEILFCLLCFYLSFQSRKFIVFIFISLLFICLNFIDVVSYIGTPQIIDSNNTIKIGLFNVLTQNNKYNSLKNEIKEHNPDIVILQEVDDIWLENIKELKNNYPYFLEHSRLDNFGIALYSKVPLINPKIEEWTDYGVPVISIELKSVDNSILKIYGIHTLPPTGREYFRVRNEMLAEINKIASSNSGEKIIFAGDFNTSIYSVSYKNYIKNSNLNDAQILAKTLKGTWNTRHFSFLRIALEHVLIPADVKLNSFQIGRDFGSDHLPIFVNLSF